ncbi:MAG: two-component sensor histidine kinase [Hirschia sp.]|nr:two-component sensor histidine kinase [Hirschia sp.]MBF16915.1 two-component sensor histidine kinase [Hirschia sp.]
MSDTPYVRLNDLFRSSHMRLATLVAGAVFACYLLAGRIAYGVLGAELEQRVQDAARYAALDLEKVFTDDGRSGLVAAVDARAQTTNPEDAIYWLGDAGGETLAGQQIRFSPAIATGDYAGDVLGRDGDDAYRIEVARLDGLVLITGASYEESDEIKAKILSAFAIATFLSFVLAGLMARRLAAGGQKRIEAIDATLRRAASGDLDARIPEQVGDDDLARLCGRINGALGQLAGTVEGIRQVSANVAHDLRTPVNRLGIRLEGLKSSLADNPEYEDQLDAALEESRTITRTFDAILRIAQIESGARRARFQSVPLSDIVRRLRDAFEAVVEDNGQSIRFNNDDISAGQLVFGDSELLTQMFANLIENAIRHAGPGAQIRVHLSSDISGVTLVVSDNGPGIPTDERDKVLDRFYRLDKSRSTAGSGLGLSLVRAIADLHDATLTLDDAGPGLMVVVHFPHFYNALRTNGGAE